MKKRIMFFCALMLALMLSVCALADGTVVPVPEKTSLFIVGGSDGPEVTKIIVELSGEATSVSAEGLTMVTADKKHEVGQVYLCDAEGNPTEAASTLVAFEVGEEIVEEGESSGFSFFSGSVFGRDASMISVWADSYQVELNAERFVVDGVEVALAINENCIGNRICPDAERFNYRSSFTGTYMNHFTGEKEEQTLHIAAYQPESLAGGEKNPVIIWLHGQGEGGVDPDIAILGNEVSALAKESIQSYFTTGDVVGAYVLVPQCQTYWMDEGDGTNGSGGGVSRYTEILKDTIAYYLAQNPDADPDRVYIGGCSNGGYMTVNMLISYPELFAAAYPLCEGYSYYLFDRAEDGSYQFAQSAMMTFSFGADDDASSGESSGDSASSGEPAQEEEKPATGFSNAIYTDDGIWMTEDKLAALAKTPIWFVSSADDSMIDPSKYVLPTYRALLQTGAQNCHLSLFASKGHFVWVPFFQNLVSGVQDAEAFAQGEIPTARNAENAVYPIAATDEGGGTLPADGYTNIFAWLNAQHK